MGIKELLKRRSEANSSSEKILYLNGDDAQVTIEQSTSVAILFRNAIALCEGFQISNTPSGLSICNYPKHKSPTLYLYTNPSTSLVSEYWNREDTSYEQLPMTRNLLDMLSPDQNPYLFNYRHDTGQEIQSPEQWGSTRFLWVSHPNRQTCYLIKCEHGQDNTASLFSKPFHRS